MIVDAHTHIVEPGSRSPGNRPACADDLVRLMDASNVDVSIVIPSPDSGSNQFVQREVARFPSRLAALYCPDFSTPGNTIPALERFVEQHAPRGLKIHPRMQHVTVEDAVVIDVIAWAAEHGMPVVVDTFPWGPSLDNPRIHPMAYHAVAQRYPGLSLVLAHAGGYKVLEALMVAKASANVYLDVSFTFDYYRGASVETDLAFACGRLACGRVLYGSDFPHVGFAEYLGLARAQLAGLPDAHSRALFGNAARDLFQLK